MDGILRPPPHDPDSEGTNPGCLPGFLDKKSPPHVRGPVSLGFFDENNVCAAVMEESDGLRTADFQVWARRRSKKKEKPEPRVGRVIPVSSGSLIESFRFPVLVSVSVRTTTRGCGIVTARLEKKTSQFLACGRLSSNRRVDLRRRSGN